MPSVLGTPQIHNEYFSHNEPHNDAPSVSVRSRGTRASESRDAQLFTSGYVRSVLSWTLQEVQCFRRRQIMSYTWMLWTC